ncbi:L-serine ammonia-lyase, iron-sulfur-dependent, subunit beta [Mitsuokella jalaludinii]|uniref:L-serine ammonia-lyase n=1 Tax=Mitsuokella jalaludinii TaxID=187979 RepID=A0A173XR81_9FIRM|nr:L-serine ammonia-lyase, iron-sulfur-dependent, subunit alpha [Mitsuokella jalaludinii]CUN53085.1 L-serine dehydratase%2C alpha chain [Mitsuokella jalaludinii]
MIQSDFNTVAELLALAESQHVPVHEVVLAREMHDRERSRGEVLQEMLKNWQVMQESIVRGIQNTERSLSGMTGGDARRLYAHREQGYMGSAAIEAAAYAVGISEVNAVMGRIVACPTAGSCGIVPAALYAAKKQRRLADGDIVLALLTAAGMAAAALVELAGGTPAMIGNGTALAIKNLMGLVCDPVAGLVEVPCVKRNGFATVVAMTAADMAMAGIRSVIPVDEVIAAMNEVGHLLPKSLRETSEAGLAVTPTAKAIEKRVYPD